MNDITQGSIPKHLLKLAGFIAVAMTFQTLYYLVDLYFVAGLGEASVAGLSLCGNLAIAVLALTQMLGVGTSSLIGSVARCGGSPGFNRGPTGYWIPNISLSCIVSPAVVEPSSEFRSA